MQNQPIDPQKIDFGKELLEIAEIREIVRKKDGSQYNHAVIAAWIRKGLFAAKVVKYGRPLIPRWAVERFTPPEQSGKTWVRRPDYQARKAGKNE